MKRIEFFKFYPKIGTLGRIRVSMNDLNIQIKIIVCDIHHKNSTFTIIFLQLSHSTIFLELLRDALV